MIKITAMMILLTVSMPGMAADTDKTEKMKVYGACEMCKERIEKAALKGGAIKADWNQESEILEVIFNEREIKLSEIEKAVVKAGHDTDTLNAEDKTYAKLPHCCHYERAKKKE